MWLLKLLYFLAIGWWLSALAALLGYLLCVSVIGLPFGVLILNRLPFLVYLTEPPSPEYPEKTPRDELPFLLRVVWFFVLGWEAGLVVLVLGYLAVVTVIGIPLGIYLLNRVPLVLTLRMHYS